MKGCLFTLTLFLLSTVAFTQITLFRDEMLPFGSVIYQSQAIDAGLIDTTIQGMNVTWDFEALLSNGIDPLVITISEPEQLPNSSSFPLANYAEIRSFDSQDYFYYFNLLPNKMEELGFNTSFLEVYEDPKTLCIFPLSFGTSNDDSWASLGSDRVYNIACIGAGTLVLPSGSFDALMVRVRAAWNGFYHTDYFWYGADNGVGLLRYNDNYFEGNIFVPEKAFYTSDLYTPVEESDIINFLSYNNPVRDNLMVHLSCIAQTMITYSLFNAEGALVFQNHTSVGTKMSELKIDLSPFPPGIYFLSLQPESKAIESKTIQIINTH